MTERTIERLNYFNGQRLEADDLRLEQEYHMRIQRWLSKSLFSPGVADGLEVSIVTDTSGKKTRVLVTPGLALDDLGRAVISVRPVELLPQARYLCVRYVERKDRPREEPDCSVRGASAGSVTRAGGPERIVSDAEFVWRASIPANDARELVIAELDLAGDCQVTAIAAGALRTAVPAQVSRVFSFALEGEKDISTETPKRILFHITGRRPNRILLCLKSFPVSTLHYSELAPHTHASDALSLPEHTHSLAGVSTEKGGVHTHEIFVRRIESDNPVKLDENHGFPGNAGGLSATVYETLVRMREHVVAGVVPTKDYEAKNQHLLELTENFPTTKPAHGHSFAQTAHTGGALTAAGGTGGVSVSAAGASHETGMHYQAGQGTTAIIGSVTPAPNALFHVSSLRVTYDTVIITEQILARIKERDPAKYGTWKDKLGDGTAAHPFVTEGTGLIRIDDMGAEGRQISTTKAEHVIELTVTGPRNGGCVHYNLYVE